MWLFDSIKAWVKKGTDTVIDTTAKVGNYMEEKSSTLMEKVPGGHEFKEKASTYTEKAVDRIGTETKEMIKEGHEFVDSHMKHEAKPADTIVPPVTPVESVAPVVEVVPIDENKVVEKEHTEPKKSHTHKKQ